MLYKEIENYSNNEQEKIKYTLAKSTILSPIECILASINPKIYYSIFKVINRGKTKKIKELEDNFKQFPFSSF